MARQTGALPAGYWLCWAVLGTTVGGSGRGRWGGWSGDGRSWVGVVTHRVLLSQTHSVALVPSGCAQGQPPWWDMVGQEGTVWAPVSPPGDSMRWQLEGAGGFAGAGVGSTARPPLPRGAGSVVGAQMPPWWVIPWVIPWCHPPQHREHSGSPDTTVMGVNEPIDTAPPPRSLPSVSGRIHPALPARDKEQPVNHRANRAEGGGRGGAGCPGTGVVPGNGGVGLWRLAPSGFCHR